MWMAQAGFEKRIMAYGATTLYGEYGRYNDMLLGYAGFSGDGGLPASVAAGDIAEPKYHAGASERCSNSMRHRWRCTRSLTISTLKSGRRRRGNAATEPWYGVVLGSRSEILNARARTMARL